MASKELARARVAKGAEWCDKHYTGAGKWYEVVSVARLDLLSSTMCILGQTEGTHHLGGQDWHGGFRVVCVPFFAVRSRRDPRMAPRNFDTRIGVRKAIGLGFVNDPLEWRVLVRDLEEAWHLEIADRFVAEREALIRDAIIATVEFHAQQDTPVDA